MTELIGITGLQCSGKDAVADILRINHGFEAVTSSDVIRDHIRDNGLGNPTRPLMTEVARELRQYDPARIIRDTIDRGSTERLAVSGLYSAAEAKYFVEVAGGTIIECAADRSLRYQRALERGRIGDDVDLTTFEKWEELESHSADPRHQAISEVAKLAVATVFNDGSFEQLEEHVAVALVVAGVVPHV